MQSWNTIVQTAMLGTDKKQVGPDELTEDLAPAITTIHNNTAVDKEEQFLQVAALLLNYRQSGAMPLHEPAVMMPVAAVETLPYCSAQALQVLKDILTEDSVGLLHLWLQRCAAQQQIAHPQILPSLLDKAVKHRPLRSLTEQCAGQRGKWLSQFNREWQFTSGESDEEQWQTGTTDQRKQVLQQLRAVDAGKAREWLQQVWPQENANTRADLLKVFSVNLSEQDIAWLESLLGDKSQKVQEEVMRLLKRIPGSAIVKTYWQVAQEAVTLKKEKALLSLSTKTSIQVQLPATINEQIFTTGIEQLSNQKEFTDQEFIVGQLIESIPPSYWELHFELSPAEIITLFQKDESKKKFLRFFVIALVQFHDQRWAIAFMQYAQVFYLDIIPLLPIQQQEYYSNKFFIGNEDSITRYAMERETEWGMELTGKIFSYTSKNHYAYNRSFYNQYIHLVPSRIIGELDNYLPSDEYQRSVWSNTSAYITKLVALKTQIIASF